MTGIRIAMNRGVQALSLWLLAAGSASASHFIGGNMYHTIDANGMATVTIETLWDKGHQEGREPFPFDGARSLQIRDAKGKVKKSMLLRISQTTVLRDTSNPDFDFRRQQVTLDFAKLKLAPGIYTIRTSSCCRIRGIRNIGASLFALEDKLIFGDQANASPQLNAGFITTIARGHEYSQNIGALDPDGSPLYYQLLWGSKFMAPGKAIPGLGINNDGRLSIPAAQTAVMKTGHWVFKVQVTDASGSYAQRDIMVNVVDAQNNPPVVGPLGSRSITVGDTLNLTVPVSDPENDPVVIAARSVPQGATFSQLADQPATGQLQWTPQAGQEGLYQIQIEARDKGLPALSSSESLTLLVEGSNQPPLLDPVSDATVPAGGTLHLDLRCADPDAGNTVSFSASFLPQGAQFNSQDGHASLDWTPATDQANKVARGLVFRCTDNGTPPLHSETVINISVGAVNQTPILQAMQDQDLLPGSSLSLPVGAYDADTGNVVHLSASSLPANASFTQASGNPANSTFQFTPTSDQAGQSYLMTFAATDDGNPSLSSSQTVRVKVIANRTPVARAGADQTIQAHGSIADVRLDGSTSTDADGDALSYRWSGAINTASGPNPLVRLPIGTHTLTLIVNDGKADSEPDSVIIRVLPPGNSQ